MNVTGDNELLALLLVSLRMLPLGLALGLLSAGVVPLAVSLSLSLSLALVLWPSAPLLGPVSGGALLLAGIRELCIGGTFALALSLALMSVAWAVQLSDANETYVALRARLAVPYVLCAAWLLFALRAPLALLVGLADSLREAAPSGTAFSAQAFAFGVVDLVTAALLTAIGFALPLVATLWLLSITFAFGRRALAPPGLAAQPSWGALALTLASALLLVPIASRAPEAVRTALASARALTRALAR